MFEDDDEHDGTDEIDALCREALARFEDSDFESARERAMEAIQLDDEHPFPMFVLGLIAEHQGDIPSARAMSELALQSAATNPDAISLRVQVHLHEHEFEEAEALLRFGIAHNPDDAELHEGLARIALAQGHFDDARSAASAALRLDPGSAGALGVRIAANEQLADRSELLAVLRQTAQMFPDDPHALVELAAAEAENGSVDRARRLLARAHRIAPHDARVAEVRVMVETIHEHPLLRHLPAVLRWVRDFPGSIVGLIMGLAIASLPLALVVEQHPLTLPPIALLLSAWSLVALYAWVGPAVAMHRLNMIAAERAADALMEQLTTPGALRVNIDEDSLADALSLLFGARRYRQARELLGCAARECDMPARGEFANLLRRLGALRWRAAQWLLLVPGERRLLVALALLLGVTAPALDPLPYLTAPWLWAGALASIALAGLLLIIEQRPHTMLEQTMQTIEALADEQPDASDAAAA